MSITSSLRMLLPPGERKGRVPQITFDNVDPMDIQKGTMHGV